MINRKAFFEIFFYNRENPSRELMEMAENVWRAYMKKYGLGLDAGSSGEPTYEEVREITYMANYAVEMVEKQIAQAAEEEERRKKAARDAWENAVVEAVEQPAKAPEEDWETPAEEDAAEPEEAEADPAEDEAPETPEIPEAPEAVEAVHEEIPDDIQEDSPEEPPVPVIQEQLSIPVAEPQPMQAPVSCPTAEPAACAEVDALIPWCQEKGLLCIKTQDEGDCYLHVYLPHKKDVHHVGTWCFCQNQSSAALEAELTKMQAYCSGYAACFARLRR